MSRKWRIPWEVNSLKSRSLERLPLVTKGHFHTEGTHGVPLRHTPWFLCNLVLVL
jgi:hypothetical protein